MEGMAALFRKAAEGDKTPPSAPEQAP